MRQLAGVSKAAFGILVLMSGASAFACGAAGREIVGAKTKTVGSYTEAGKFTEEIPSGDLLKKQVAACSEFNPSLAKVVIDEKRTVWIDLTEVTLEEIVCDQPKGAAQGSEITKTYSESSDAKKIAASAIGDCNRS